MTLTLNLTSRKHRHKNNEINSDKGTHRRDNGKRI